MTILASNMVSDPDQGNMLFMSYLFLQDIGKLKGYCVKYGTVGNFMLKTQHWADMN